MFKDFNRRFGIATTLDEEKNKFVERVITFINNFRAQFLEFQDYKKLFNTICVQFGKNPQDYILSVTTYTSIADLEEVSGKDFLSILKLWTAIRVYYRENEQITSLLDDSIVALIEKSEIDLQIRHSEGQFYPAKELLLDKDLVDFSLKALQRYPDEAKDFEIALQQYNSSNKYGVIEYCYRCMEGLSRKILNNNKTLIDNKGDLLKRIVVNDNWKRILANYIEYGNEFGRHASTKRHAISDKEVEGYLYLTGLLVRLIFS